jgi:hypothetical protein
MFKVDGRAAANRRTARRLQKEHRGLWGISPERKLEISSKGGQATGEMFYREGRGLFGMSKEAKLAASLRAGKAGGSRTARIPGALSRAGRVGGPEGGRVMGTHNRNIGWMQHINKIRYGNSHRDCKFCLRFHGIRPPVQ